MERAAGPFYLPEAHQTPAKNPPNTSLNGAQTPAKWGLKLTQHLAKWFSNTCPNCAQLPHKGSYNTIQAVQSLNFILPKAPSSFFPRLSPSAQTSFSPLVLFVF